MEGRLPPSHREEPENLSPLSELELQVLSLVQSDVYSLLVVYRDMGGKQADSILFQACVKGSVRVCASLHTTRVKVDYPRAWD